MQFDKKTNIHKQILSDDKGQKYVLRRLNQFDTLLFGELPTVEIQSYPTSLIQNNISRLSRDG